MRRSVDTTSPTLSGPNAEEGTLLGPAQLDYLPRYRELERPQNPELKRLHLGSVLPLRDSCS